MNFTVVGTGYVGLSLAVLISQKFSVKALDIDKKKINLIKAGKSPIKDVEIEKYLSSFQLKLEATLDKYEAYKNSDYVIIATPTNYDIETGSFDTSKVEQVIKEIIEINSSAVIIIKSTIPLGFTDKMRRQFNYNNIYFSPEFLREGKALYDNLYPSRIVVGGNNDESKFFGKVLAECSSIDKNKIPIHYIRSKEAEAVKLFANTFLAMRIAYFNELDTFSEVYNLSTKNIINAICDDPRIGNYYNNPSFGYGGYCLPKDTKQLLDNYKDIPSTLIKAVIDSNKTRKQFIVQSIIEKQPKSVGIYKLAMKMNSDNFRESAVLDIIDQLQKKGIPIFLYEPLLKDIKIKNVEIIDDLSSFIKVSHLIISNRLSEELHFVNSKVYSRDIFKEN